MKQYYCGTDKFPDWLRRVLSFGVNDACKLHDINYLSKHKSKAFWDFIFLYHMILVSTINILKGFFGLCVAPFYFIAVLFFGRRSWKDKK